MLSLEEVAQKIMSVEGRASLEEWQRACDELLKDGNLDAVKAIHRKVGSHLAVQIVNTFSGEELDESKAR